MPTTFLSAATTQQFHQQQNSPPFIPTWADEFLDFSSARRGAHRRSASDSVAFLDTAFLAAGGNHHLGFDRLDDDQLISMFSDVDVGGAVSMLPSSSATASMSTPSTPSDQNSNDDDETPMALDDVVLANQEQWQPKNEPLEVESACKNEISDTPPPPPPPSAGGETVFDPKRVKRILANRQSAQRSRVRKLQYISELERSVSTLQTEVSALSPRVAFLDHQRLLLNVDNSALKQRIAALAQDKIFKDAHHEALRKEIERLRQIYEHQMKMEKSVNNTHNCLHSSSQALGCTDKDELLC
ncbi:basic leucine zipper 61-like [Senna tora]|uniref:Basic leucine zipper 61-like n=1 Tax=Senna tora TaxID=362788 RepID=A0A835CDC7_9FABA|nr:basic leucine zipper 61-like [Senna tora]